MEERRLGYNKPLFNNNDTLKSNTKQLNSLLPDDEDFLLDGLRLSNEQRKAINNLDMINQLSVIRELREQQGVEKPKPKKENEAKSEQDILLERVDKANREIKIAET